MSQTLERDVVTDNHRPSSNGRAQSIPPMLVRTTEVGDVSSLIDLEWLVTNGLGGYASGTVAGAATRRYHGLLIAAHPAPLGRLMLLSNLQEEFQFPDRAIVTVQGAEQLERRWTAESPNILRDFRLEMGLPVWEYAAHGHVVEKRVYMPRRQNTVHVQYRLLSGPGPVVLKLRASVHFRGHDDPVTVQDPAPYTLTACERRYELTSSNPQFPALRFFVEGESAALTLDGIKLPDVLYRVEEGRGYDNKGMMWSPGVFRVLLKPGNIATLTASTEPWERIMAMSPQEALEMEMDRREHLLQAAPPVARDSLGGELVLAADQFIITPAGRVGDAARAQATGGEALTVIAGYHWFTDWGRDTMISLEGLTLLTGRHAEAGSILQTFISHVRDGLIPNFFPDQSTEGVYHTADATLWYFHALSRYLHYTHDQILLHAQLPTLKRIIEHHQKGTRFGIGVDHQDGLLSQGAPGYQLTWMDAKVGDWVVTPRRGKAVEINALWYNALLLLAGWLKEAGDPEYQQLEEAAGRARESFNRRFWCAEEHGLYDVIDGEQGDDPACRPNQLFAFSLEHPILAREHWDAVLETVGRRLLTPVGLRSLAPGHPDYKSRYYGDLRSRDAAYHQGTVWAWLIGPFLDAWLRVHPDKRDGARRLLEGFDAHLSKACVGTISEIFDADPPFTARGCAAQAWSVAEALRVWALTGPSHQTSSN